MTRKTTVTRKNADPAQGPAVDLDRYVPAYFTFIANKLARGASSHYLETYGVGIETWRIMVMLAIEKRVTAQRVCQLIGMDKGSVSRAFRSMHSKGLLAFSSDALDGRLRFATFTKKGRDMHDSIMRFALQREHSFLSVLDQNEINTLIDLLRRLHENLPQVEVASDQFIARAQTARMPKISAATPRASK